MPKLPDDIPSELKDSLTDPSFIELENQHIRAILASPADPNVRYSAGKMYERFGLACPALMAYQQTLSLDPFHRRAMKRAADLEALGTVTNDDEGFYKLPPLKIHENKSHQNPTGEHTSKDAGDNSLGIVRLGTIDDVNKVMLKKGDHDDRFEIAFIGQNKLVLKSHSRWWPVFLISHTGSVCFAILALLMFIFEIPGLARAPGISAAFAIFFAIGSGLLFLFHYRSHKEWVIFHADGRVIFHEAETQNNVWKMLPGSRVLLELSSNEDLNFTYCTISLVNANYSQVQSILTAEQEKTGVAIYPRIAAVIAAVTGVSLQITGSIRETEKIHTGLGANILLTNRALIKSVQDISAVMTPIQEGAVV